MHKTIVSVSKEIFKEITKESKHTCQYNCPFQVWHAKTEMYVVKNGCADVTVDTKSSNAELVNNFWVQKKFKKGSAADKFAKKLLPSIRGKIAKHSHKKDTNK